MPKIDNLPETITAPQLRQLLTILNTIGMKMSTETFFKIVGLIEKEINDMAILLGYEEEGDNSNG